MKNNQVLNILVFLLIIISEMACQSVGEKNIPSVLEGSYKEIVENTFTKQISPETNKTSLYNKTSEVIYIYEGNLLKEKNVTKTVAQKELETKELFSYSGTGEITERKVFFTQTNSLYIKETFDYDEKGEWKFQRKEDANNRVVGELKVVKRNQNIVEGEGFEERGKIHLQVKNLGQDSTVLLDALRNGKKISRQCEYKKDRFGNVIFEKCIQLNGDSLPSVVKSRFEMDSKNKEWVKKISEKKFKYIDDKEYHFKDSIIRTVAFESEPASSTKESIVGTWQFKKEGNWVDFQKDLKFVIYENNRFSANGNWKLESQKNQIRLSFLTGDNKGDVIIWQINSLYNDLLKIDSKRNVKYLKRRKKG